MFRVWAGARWALALAVVLCAWQAVAQPALSTVDDVIYRADGQRLNGWAQIEWKSFLAADASTIAAYSKNVLIVDGVLKVNLTPTTTAPAGAYYLVKYFINGRLQFTEYWAVRPSATALRLRDIQLVGPPAAGTSIGNASGEPVAINDVVGLNDELNARPKRGLAYSASKAAVINNSGDLDAAVGDPNDCVRVNGTTGPCSSSGGPAFADDETPAGLINGSNATFTLANAPNPASSLLLYRNGLLQRATVDYTLSGSIVTFVGGAIPQPGDLLMANYRLSESGLPSGQASGALSGYFPAPSIAPGAIGDLHIAGDAAIAESKLALAFPTHSTANDPTADQKGALAGTSGSPSSANRYVTDQDPRMTNSRLPSAHSILSGAHADSNPGVVARGDLIVGQGTAPTLFSRLPLGAANRCLISNGSDAVWNACLFTGFPAGTVPFVDGTGNLVHNVSRLFWDNSNRRLGVGVNTPSSTLTVHDTSVGDGVTSVTVRAGMGQASTPLQVWQNESGTAVAAIASGGGITAPTVKATATWQASWQETGLALDPVSPAEASLWFNTAEAARKSAEAGQSHTLPQVICSIAGGSTNAITPTALGSCTIRSQMIHPGDRFEVRYHVSHEGGTTPFSYTLYWGNAILAARSGTGAEEAAAGQVDAFPATSMVYWNNETWGSSASQMVAASAAAISTGDVKVELFGQLSAGGADSVTMRHLSIVRLPAQPNP